MAQELIADRELRRPIDLLLEDWHKLQLSLRPDYAMKADDIADKISEFTLDNKEMDQERVDEVEPESEGDLKGVEIDEQDQKEPASLFATFNPADITY